MLKRRVGFHPNCQQRPFAFLFYQKLMVSHGQGLLFVTEVKGLKDVEITVTSEFE